MAAQCSIYYFFAARIAETQLCKAHKSGYQCVYEIHSETSQHIRARGFFKTKVVRYKWDSNSV